MSGVALCVIFSILDSFSRDNALFAWKAKINVFWKFFSNGAAPKGPAKWRKFFQKTLILAFEVIVQPPKTHFLTFSKVQKHIMEKKSETKIMKITHSGLSDDASVIFSQSDSRGLDLEDVCILLLSDNFTNFFSLLK